MTKTQFMTTLGIVAFVGGFGLGLGFITGMVIGSATSQYIDPASPDEAEDKNEETT